MPFCSENFALALSSVSYKKKDFIYFRKTLGLCVVVQRISAFTTNSVEFKAHFEIHPILAFIS